MVECEVHYNQRVREGGGGRKAWCVPGAPRASSQRRRRWEEGVVCTRCTTGKQLEEDEVVGGRDVDVHPVHYEQIVRGRGGVCTRYIVTKQSDD